MVLNQVLKMKKISLFISTLLLCVGLNGCAQNLSPNTYDGSAVGVASTVKKGMIIAKRPVNINNNSGAGGLAGAATGAAAGSMVGGNTATNVIGAIGGAVIGGLAGNAIDSGINNHNGYEYIIRLNNGKSISVVQVQEMVFSVHQRVLVIYGRTTRLVPDDTRA